MKSKVKAGKPSPAKAISEGTAVERPLRPAQCRTYMRKVLAEEFRGIVDGFVKGAKRGSCQHVKLATELLEAKRTTEPRQSGRRTLKKLVRRLEQIED